MRSMVDTANAATDSALLAAFNAYWDSGAEDQALLDVLMALYQDAIKEAYNTANAMGAGVGYSFDLHNPRLQSFLSQMAQRVTGINQTTRDAIAQVISDGMAQGYSTAQISDGVPEADYPGISGVFADARGYRAKLIARTEASNTYNKASVMAYRDSGRVQRVEVMDGTHDPGCADANGSIWDLDYAEANPLQHPNCSRCFVPLVEPVTP